VVWLRAGKVDGAAAEFRAALAADPKDLESMTNLAVVTRQTGHSDEAWDLLQRALALEPRQAASHYNMALMCEERGDLEGAIRHYRAFLDNSTSDQAALAGDVRARLTVLVQARQAKREDQRRRYRALGFGL
jgi:Flp pilus assembly protein TadD